MSLVRFGVRHPVPANLVMVAIIGFGVIYGLNVRREFFPETRPTEVIVNAPYPGASPDEVEDSLATKIENQLTDLEDVKEISSTASEGAAQVRIEFGEGVDIALAVSRVKREVDALQDLPQEAERITVEDFVPKLPVINLTLYGDADERTMKDAILQMRDDLRSLPGLGEIAISGVRVDEIAVEVDEADLLEQGMSLIDVSERVRAGMIELPGGSVRSPTANVTLRTLGAEERVDEVRQIVVKSAPDGRNVRLGEIADVEYTFADVDLRTRLNGQRSVTLVPYAPSKEDSVRLAESVRAYVAGRLREPIEMTRRERTAFERAEGGEQASLTPRLQAYRLGLSRLAPPPGEVRLHNDLSRFITQRLDLLARNALWGAGLVFVTLMLLLTPRVAFWVTVGLTVSILGSLAAMAFLDISLNLLTMFGLIVVLGLLVDDAIVVAENITARHEQGEPALVAARKGGEQVAWPVTATIITTIFAFWPLRLVEGRIGDIIGALPIVVAIALLVSLVESLLILPSHMAHDLHRVDRGGDRRGLLGAVARRADRVRETIFDRILGPAYLAVLRPALRARYLTITIGLAVVIGSVGMVAGGRVPFNFLSSTDSEFVVADVRMPIGTPVERTDDVVRRIERAALDLPEVRTILTTVGSRQDVDTGLSTSQPHLAQLNMELVPGEERERSSEDIVQTIKDRLGVLAGVKSLRFTEVGAGPSGPDITLTVVSETPRRIEPVVERLKQMLANYEGVQGIADDADAGQRELRIALRPGASELGFTTDWIARQMRGAVFGLEPHTFAGREEDVDVRVMYPESARRSLADLESMFVFTPDGVPVPLGEVATLEEAQGYATIRRLNGRRAVTVTADVDPAVGSPESVTSELLPEVESYVAGVPGAQVLLRGRQEDVVDAFATLPLGAAAATGLIYVSLAWLFASYTQPFVIIFAIPFAIVGAIWGHFILGYDITILSLIGFVALIGIVVNDSLILMRFYNDRREQGAAIYDALIDAGRARLRAIILTTLTTVLGLSPLMLEQSFQARVLIPMAITISFGLMAATFVTLLILPSLLMIGADVKRLAFYLWHGRWPMKDPTPFEPGLEEEPEDDTLLPAGA